MIRFLPMKTLKTEDYCQRLLPKGWRVKCPTDRMEIRVAVPVYMSVEMPDAESLVLHKMYTARGQIRPPSFIAALGMFSSKRDFGQSRREIRPWPVESVSQQTQPQP